jgi:hypothetical protein
MEPGHIIKGQCVDVAVSTDLFWSNFEATAQSGSNLYTTVAAPTPSFASCDTTEQFFDGMQLGWLVATVMVTVFVIRRLYR